ncbi:MAG: hypothetical protein KDN20_00665 [Verrucomicrobiae bacterium]|nr:hypothetical protein [Verrucomicrobiae bacterium]
METLKSFFTHPAFFAFVGGLIVCGIFLVMSWTSHLKTKKELRRFQKHLSEKLEIEGEHMATTKKDLAKLREENENLRLKIGSGQLHDSSQALERELELFARAEKIMVVKAPGFAQAWEGAKDVAHAELLEEERGKSLPRRIFRKFFAGSGNAGGGGNSGDGTKLLAVKDAEESTGAPEKAGAASSGE